MKPLSHRTTGTQDEFPCVPVVFSKHAYQSGQQEHDSEYNLFSRMAPEAAFDLPSPDGAGRPGRCAGMSVNGRFLTANKSAYLPTISALITFAYKLHHILT